MDGKSLSLRPLNADVMDAPTVESRKRRFSFEEFANVFLFGLMHLLPLLALWTGASAADWLMCAGLFFLRMFGITAGYHRYFGHRSFRTSRWFQFLLAFLAQTSAQKGALWWASHHRLHHRHSDTPLDEHSPGQKGFWYSHLGWFLSNRTTETRWDMIRDFAKYPELVWLNRYHLAAPVALGAFTWFVGGWSMLLIGFFLSTILLYHATFTINSLAHVWGRRVYPTRDDSRNNWFLAILTLGEGWHNNHHYFPASARQGFRAHEIDATFYMLKALSWFGIVRELRTAPASVVNRTVA